MVHPRLQAEEYFAQDPAPGAFYCADCHAAVLAAALSAPAADSGSAAGSAAGFAAAAAAAAAALSGGDGGHSTSLTDPGAPLSAAGSACVKEGRGCY